MVELIICTKFKLTTVAFNTLVGGGGGETNFKKGILGTKINQKF